MQLRTKNLKLCVSVYVFVYKLSFLSKQICKISRQQLFSLLSFVLQ